MCQLIVRGCLVEGYSRHFLVLFGALRYPKSEYAYHELHTPDMWWKTGALKAWCEKRKGKHLYELQIEMCDWAISRVGKLKDVSDKEQAPFVNAVRAEIVELRKSKKAARFHGFSRNEEFELYSPESAERIRKDLEEKSRADDKPARSSGR